MIWDGAWSINPESDVRPRRAAPRATSRVGYLRLHGRNTADWFREDAGRDARYDYLYSLRELEPLAKTATELANRTEELFVVQNNHFRGQALVNGLQMKHLVHGGSHAAPSDLVRSYPQLEEIARRSTRAVCSDRPNTPVSGSTVDGLVSQVDLDTASAQLPRARPS